MAQVSLLVDTDIFIDFLNTDAFSSLLLNDEMEIYFSVITEKELLTKPGLSDSEKLAITSALKHYKRIPLSEAITMRYSLLRKKYPQLTKSDALIAASALVKNLPLTTRNKRHFKIVADLVLFG